MNTAPEPTPAEGLALFRLSIVGDLIAQDLDKGELKKELQDRAERLYLPPGAAKRRKYSWRTLETWYYAAKELNLNGLMPASRVRGLGLMLTDEQQTFLLDARREHPSASAGLILDEAVRNGVIAKGAVSVSTVRRLLASNALARRSLSRIERRERRRWAADKPGVLWHSDVCHLKLAGENGKTRTVLVFGLLDDASRCVLAIDARKAETEQDFLAVLCAALLRHPRPDVLYVDNGACFISTAVALVCERLGIRLVHAQPRDPQARGKMERLWRTMRQRCTDHLGGLATLHDVNVALWAWQDDYNAQPHSGILGKAPSRVYRSGMPGRPPVLQTTDLARALELRETRKVKGDGTFSVDSRIYEAVGQHHRGKTIDVMIDPLAGAVVRVERDGHEVRFGPCSPTLNARRGRGVVNVPTGQSALPFDPIAGLIAKARKGGQDA